MKYWINCVLELQYESYSEPKYHSNFDCVSPEPRLKVMLI